MSQDPFDIVRVSIDGELQNLQLKLSRYHGLTASNPERKTLSSSLQAGFESLGFQFYELDRAVESALKDPHRFKIAPEELSARRRWLQSSRQQVEAMKRTLATAQSAPVHLPDEEAHKTNQRFVQSEVQRQQQIMRQQDEGLDDIALAANRIKRMGEHMATELDSQTALLSHLEDDVDTTHLSLRAAQKRMRDIIRKTSSNSQMCLIIFLTVILVILASIAFA